jgi:hypothetical protein
MYRGGPYVCEWAGLISPLQGPVLTGCAEPRVLVIAIWAVRRAVTQVLDGDANSVARTSERFVRVTRVACKEEKSSTGAVPNYITLFCPELPPFCNVHLSPHV